MGQRLLYLLRFADQNMERLIIIAITVNKVPQGFEELYSHTSTPFAILGQT